MKGDLKHRFGRRVQELREAKSLTQESLAERIGRSVDTVSNIERGVNATRIETANQLALALDVRLPDLFEFRGEDAMTSVDRHKAVETLLALLNGVSTDTVLKLTRLVEAGLSLVRPGSD